jgi:hypothetical protein
MSALFPTSLEEADRPGRPPDQGIFPWSVKALGVSGGELREVCKRLRANDTAQGPNGIPAKALALASEVLGEGLQTLFNKCLEAGRFPSIWKRGRVVLLLKEGKPAETPSAYPPSPHLSARRGGQAF